MWFPSFWVTDPRARWEALNENSALLYVPLGDVEENFVVRFNTDTYLVDSLEAMRYRDAGAGAKKILWIARNVDGKKIEDTKLDAVDSATWLDMGVPWAAFTLEDVVYNVGVSEYLLQKKRGKAILLVSNFHIVFRCGSSSSNTSTTKINIL